MVNEIKTKEKALKNANEIVYCICGNAVKYFKKYDEFRHYGYNKIHEPYKDFLNRTNHKVVVNNKVKINFLDYFPDKIEAFNDKINEIWEEEKQAQEEMDEQNSNYWKDTCGGIK